MFEQSIQSLIEMDSNLARKVCLSDDNVDSLNRHCHQVIFSAIKLNPDHTSELIGHLASSRNLERIADYATSIAEDVIYMVDGAIVRHRPELYR